MKRLITLIAIALSVVSFSKAQSEVKIEVNELHAQIATELANLPIDLSDIHIDWDSMKSSIDQNLADLENISTSIDLTGLDNLANLENPNNTSNLSNLYTTTETLQDNDLLSNQLSKIKGIQVVYISKAMLKMMPKIDMPGADELRNIAGKMESLEIYIAENDVATKSLQVVSEKLINSGNYETVMLTKDDESKTAFYMKKGTSNKTEMVMIVEDDDETTILRIMGDITIEDLKNIANAADPNKNVNPANRMSEAELEMRMKEVEKRNKEVQQIAADAQKKAIEAQKRADAAEKKVREAEEKAKRAN